MGGSCEGLLGGAADEPATLVLAPGHQICTSMRARGVGMGALCL